MFSDQPINCEADPGKKCTKHVNECKAFQNQETWLARRDSLVLTRRRHTSKTRLPEVSKQVPVLRDERNRRPETEGTDVPFMPRHPDTGSLPLQKGGENSRSILSSCSVPVTLAELGLGRRYPPGWPVQRPTEDCPAEGEGPRNGQSGLDGTGFGARWGGISLSGSVCGGEGEPMPLHLAGNHGFS